MMLGQFGQQRVPQPVQRTVLGSMSGTAPSLMELRPVAIREGSETDGELIVEPIVLDRSMVVVRAGILWGMLQRRSGVRYGGELADGGRVEYFVNALGSNRCRCVVG